jgi:hypothetical protein
MTTTDTRQAETFPRFIDAKRDRPTDCPSWCDAVSHEARYAADFGTLESAQDYAEALALFQEHRHYLPELPTTLTLTHPADAKPARIGGFDMELMVSVGPSQWFPLVNVTITGTEPGEHIDAALTSGAARSYAAQLIAAADAIETGLT